MLYKCLCICISCIYKYILRCHEHLSFIHIYSLILTLRTFIFYYLFSFLFVSFRLFHLLPIFYSYTKIHENKPSCSPPFVVCVFFSLSIFSSLSFVSLNFIFVFTFFYIHFVGLLFYCMRALCICFF